MNSYLYLLLVLPILSACTLQNLNQDKYGVSKTKREDGLKILIQKDNSYPWVSLCSTSNYGLNNASDWVSAKLVSIVAEIKMYQLLSDSGDKKTVFSSEVVGPYLSLCFETNKESQDRAYTLLSDFLSSFSLTAKDFSFVKTRLDSQLKTSKATHEDIHKNVQSLNLDSLHQFYENRIHPSHTVVAIVGQIQPKRVYSFLKKRIRYRSTSQEKSKVYEENISMNLSFLENISSNKDSVSFKSPLFSHPDFTAFLLTYSLMSQALSHKQDESADFNFEPIQYISHQSMMLGWKFTPLNEKKIEIEKLVREIGSSFKSKGVSQSLYEETMWKILGDEWKKTSSFSKRAFELALWETRGQYPYTFELKQLLLEVADSHVQAVIEKYFSFTSPTTSKASAQSFSPMHILPSKENLTSHKVQYIQLPHFRYILETKPEQPYIYGSFLFRLPEFSFNVSAYLDYLYFGTQVLSSLNPSIEFQKIGAHVVPIFSYNSFGFKFCVHSSKFNEFIFLFSEMMNAPFEEKVFLKWKQGFEKQASSMDVLSQLKKMLSSMIFEKNKSKMKPFTMDDFKNFHKTVYFQDNIILTLIGPLSEQNSKGLFQKYFQKIPEERESVLIEARTFEIQKLELSQEFQTNNTSVENCIFALGFPIPHESFEKMHATIIFEWMKQKLLRTNPYFIDSEIQSYQDRALLVWMFSSPLSLKNKVIEQWVKALKTALVIIEAQKLEDSYKSVLINLEQKFNDLSQRSFLYGLNFLASGTLKPLDSLRALKYSELSYFARYLSPSAYKIATVQPLN